MIRNFAWICTWKITHRCNLSCTYCDHSLMLPATAPESIDYNNIIERIARLRPKIVNISGGEPTLVARLGDVVRELKSRWSPFIRIVHNGTQPAAAVPLFEHIDRFVVSLDGPAELNRTTRGIDGDTVVERLKDVMKEAAAHNVEVAVNCVVTVHNFTRLRELAGKLRAASPRILLSFTPVMPPGGALSILSDKSAYGEFKNLYASLRAEGFNVMHIFDALERHDNFSCIQCYNQYFVVRVAPEGRITACPMNVPLSHSMRGVQSKKLFSKRGMGRALAQAGRALKVRLGGRADFSCSNICNCESWLDMLFLGIKSESAAVYLRGLHGRMSDRDYRELDTFVRKNINPRFDVGAFKRLVDHAS